MSGFVKIPRDLLTRALASTKGRLTGEQALLWLTLEASWAERDYDINGTSVRVGRGQLACSVRYLAQAWRWPRNTVFNFLKRLQAAGLINRKLVRLRDTRGTSTRTPISLITICNYECSPKEQTAIGTSTGALPGRIRDETEEYKNIKDICADSKPGKERKRNPRKEGFDASSVSPHFEAFIAAYPKRQGGQGWTNAKKLFVAAVKSGEDPAAIVRGASGYAASLPRDSLNTKYVKMAETFLRQQMWKEFQPPPEDVVAVRFKATPGSAQFEAWKSHYASIGQVFMVKLVKQRELESRPWSFESEWPPGYQPPAPKLVVGGSP
jgi:hypothetical protein